LRLFAPVRKRFQEPLFSPMNRCFPVVFQEPCFRRSQVDLARLVALLDAKSVLTWTRADASAERLDALRQSGPLPQVRYRHLATHGQGDETVAFASALVLMPPSRPPPLWKGAPYRDGRLTAAEGLEFWQLDAELVTWSACESGLGQRGGGEGLLGFAQAFLKVGSRSVCLPLWPADDPATALRRCGKWGRFTQSSDKLCFAWKMYRNAAPARSLGSRFSLLAGIAGGLPQRTGAFRCNLLRLLRFRNPSLFSPIFPLFSPCATGCA
jgi:hypothetical protein